MSDNVLIVQERQAVLVSGYIMHFIIWGEYNTIPSHTPEFEESELSLSDDDSPSFALLHKSAPVATASITSDAASRSLSISLTVAAFFFAET